MSDDGREYGKKRKNEREKVKEKEEVETKGGESIAEEKEKMIQDVELVEVT